MGPFNTIKKRVQSIHSIYCKLERDSSEQLADHNQTDLIIFLESVHFVPESEPKERVSVKSSINIDELADSN